MPAKRIEVPIGGRFGKVTVIKETGKGERGHILFLCECDCGKRWETTASALKRGLKSCSCKHGLSGTRLYRLWSDIKARCYSPSNKGYGNYGGRGITIHGAWKDDPEAFITWIQENLGDRPTNRHSLDRIDVNDGYRPGNLRWADTKEQARNKRANYQVHPEFYKLLTEPLEFTYREGDPAARTRIDAAPEKREQDELLV